MATAGGATAEGGTQLHRDTARGGHSRGDTARGREDTAGGDIAKRDIATCGQSNSRTQPRWGHSHLSTRPGRELP